MCVEPWTHLLTAREPFRGCCISEPRLRTQPHNALAAEILRAERPRLGEAHPSAVRADFPDQTEPCAARLHSLLPRTRDEEGAALYNPTSSHSPRPCLSLFRWFHRSTVCLLIMLYRLGGSLDALAKD